MIHPIGNLKGNIKKRALVKTFFKTVLLLVALGTSVSLSPVLGEEPEFTGGKILFEDDFKNPASSKEKYDEGIKGIYEEKQSEVKFQEGFVQLLSPWNQVTALRTKVETDLQDDGSTPVLYSVRLGAASRSPVTMNTLLVRLGPVAFNSGYAIQQYYDGRNAILSIARIYQGEKALFTSKCPATHPEETANEFPQLLSDDPANVLAVRLENVKEGVKLSVYFNDELLKTIIDDSPERITEGNGVGMRYLNHVGEYKDAYGNDLKHEILGGQFTNLKVVQAK
jgi:hypothetical protein